MGLLAFPTQLRSQWISLCCRQARPPGFRASNNNTTTTSARVGSKVNSAQFSNLVFQPSSGSSASSHQRLAPSIN